MDEIEKLYAYVLWSRYRDGSGADICRVYFDEYRARDDAGLANAAAENGGQEYLLNKTLVVGDCP